MNATLEQLRHLRPSTPQVAMATLVATRGTSPKKEGAKMWVGADGSILGAVTIGGCVDAQVIAESESALKEHRSRLLSVSLGDQEAWELGLTCSGTVEVLIEPLDLTTPTDPVREAYAAAEAELRAGRWTAVVAPLHGPATRLVVFQDGRIQGTLGDPALDQDAAARARDLLPHGTSRTLHLKGSNPEQETAAFFEILGPAANLIVVGAGAVAMPLVTLARGLGLHSVVVDGRPRFATPERLPEADEIRVGIPSEIVAGLPLHASTLVVLVAHDYKYDLPVLREVLRHEVGYIGLLGSRRRGRAILDFLREEGIPEADLQRIHVPVGLDIGAQTAPEIALSVLAEAVAVRNGRPGTPLRERASS